MPCTCVEECECVCNCENCVKGLLCDFDHYDDCEYRCDFCKAEQYEYTEQTNRKLFI
jgi:hypothetical protein